jgi:hypothetical protein
MPSYVHGASLAFFFDKFFENLAHHEFFSHKLPPLPWSNVLCPFVDK